MIKKIQSKAKDFNLTPMGIGAGLGFGGYFTKNLKNNSEQVRLIEEACDLGINVIDTAEIYGAGASEETIGRTSQSIRNQLFIMSKFSPENSKPEDIIKSIDASLTRIKRDYLDVYQPHWPQPGVRLEDILETLEKLKLSGKIRFSGLSNFSSQQINSVNNLEKYNSLRFLQCERNPVEYNLANDLLPIIDSLDGVLVAFSPFREGQIFKSTKFDELERFSKSLGFTPSQLILAWGMANGKTIVIPKVSSSKHLRENFESMEISLSNSDIDYISDLFKPKIKEIPPEDIIPDISVKDERKIYKTLKDAKNNIYDYHPGPMEILKEIQDNHGSLFKPIKVKELNNDGKYVLLDGRLRFWAWVILNGWHKPIESIIIEGI